jgi:hypothetical protein
LESAVKTAVVTDAILESAATGIPVSITLEPA